MAEFGDNFEQDPAAEFLQREQNALAGLEDEIPPANAQPNGKPTWNFSYVLLPTITNRYDNNLLGDSSKNSYFNRNFFELSHWFMQFYRTICD